MNLGPAIDRPRYFGVRLHRRRFDEGARLREKYKSLTEKNEATGITRGLAAFIGIAELAGSARIILPMTSQHCSLYPDHGLHGS